MTVRAEADRIHTACDEIEIAYNDLTDAGEWRIALGLIDDAQRRVYALRKVMLNEAIRQAREARDE